LKKARSPGTTDEEGRSDLAVASRVWTTYYTVAQVSFPYHFEQERREEAKYDE